MRRAVATPLACLLLLVLGASAAWGHAAFREREVPAESEQTLVLRVPEERPGDVTVGVETLVPEGFEVLDCPSEEPWTCEVEEGEERLILTWSRDAGDGDAELAIVVGTPTEPDDYRWPTIQTYDSGTEVAWAQRAGEERPAPVLTVVGSDAPVVEDTEDPAEHRDEPQAATVAPAQPTPSVSPAPIGGDDDGGGPAVTITVVLAVLAVAGWAIARAQRGPRG